MLERCPQCGQLTLAWDSRCKAWLCLAVNPYCYYSETRDMRWPSLQERVDNGDCEND